MKHKMELEDMGFDFEGWAFLHFHSKLPAYAFADSLNRLYDYRLARVDDVPLCDAEWPLYRYELPQNQYLVFLVERPAMAVDAAWDAGDKLLIVKGETAELMARRIYADFTDSVEVDEGDLLAREHADILAKLLSDFTVVNMLDFEAQPSTRKAAKEFHMVQQYCDAILAHIEQSHLDLSDEVRMRLEMEKVR